MRAYSQFRNFPAAPPPGTGRGRRGLVGLILAGTGLLAASLAGQTNPALPSAEDLKKLSMEQLLDIEVTSVSKHPEKLFDTASAIQVVTADEIRRSGATRLPEALRLATNLEVAQVDSSQWAISARGFNNVFADKMLVLIDGRAVYTPLFAGVYWDAQDVMLEDLDRIEVISGPGATQWGANAVNGVINIVSKSAKDTQGGLLLAGAGTEMRSLTGFRYGGKLADGIYYRIYAKFTDRSDSMLRSGRTASDGWHSGQGGFRLDWYRTADDLITVQGDAYHGTVGRFGPDDIGMTGGNTLAQWTRTLGEGSDLTFQIYYDHTHRRIPNSFVQTLDTYDADFVHRFPLGRRQSIIWGGGYRMVDDDINNTPANAFLPSNVSHKWANAFVQDEIALAENRLRLTLGTKVEHNPYTGYEVEPNTRLAWTPDGTRTLWAAVSRAVRDPSRIDRDLYSPATPPYRVAGGPNVVSETLIATEVGYRVQVNTALAVGVSAYDNEYDNLRSLEPLKPPAAYPVQISSGLRGRSEGAELTIDWLASPTWRLHAGYNELRVSSERQPGTLDRGDSRSIALDPNHQLSLRSSWDPAKDWESDVEVRYVGPIDRTRVPGYTEMDLRLGWHPTARWELSITGQNLLHNHHVEFNPVRSRREIQRGIYFKLLWRI